MTPAFFLELVNNIGGTGVIIRIIHIFVAGPDEDITVHRVGQMNAEARTAFSGSWIDEHGETAA